MATQLPRRLRRITQMSKLPEEFADLEKFSDWCLPTEEERYQKRLNSSMAQMQELYDAGMARLEDIMVYVDARFPLDGMPEDAKALVHLGQSIVMVSFPVRSEEQRLNSSHMSISYA